MSRPAPSIATRPTPSRAPRPARALLRWLDNDAVRAPADPGAADRIDWLRALPYFAIHAACFAVFFVGSSATAVAVAAFLYFARMFFITGFYHRYFSHRSFAASRAAQFVMALLGGTAVQRGPLWWAAHHREHHAFSDTHRDPHSARLRGFLWSHTGWFLTRGNFATRRERVQDLARFPELVFLDRFDVLPPLLLAGALYAAGALAERYAPGLGTDGPQLLVWGFAISTVVLYHATYTINSLAHRIGRRRYATRDDSRNSLLLALLTLGEGWHNNHHHYPAAARQGFLWWEIDVTYYGLELLRWLGFIRDLRPVPRESLGRDRLEHGAS